MPKLLLINPILNLFSRNKLIIPPKNKNILVESSGGIGDLVFVLPVINRLIKSGYKVDFLTTGKYLSNICDHLKLFHNIYIEWKLYHINKVIELIKNVNKNKYKFILLSIGTAGSVSHNIMNKIFFRNIFKIGFNYYNIKYEETIDITNEHYLIQNSKLLLPLGLKVENNDYNFPLNETYIKSAKKYLFNMGIDINNFIIIQPVTKRSWPIYRYIEFVKLLIKKTNLQIVITGSKNERSTCEIITNSVKNDRIYLQAGDTEFLVSVAILKFAKLFVGHDTGFLHIAAILQKPIVSIFGPSSWELGGYSSYNQFIIKNNLNCSPCLWKKHGKYCRKEKFLEEISAEEVMKYVNIIIGNK